MNPLQNKDIIVVVLKWVEQRQRLSTCALVNSTWHQAARDATTYIHTSCRSNSQVEALNRWLQQHPNDAAVNHLKVRGTYLGRTSDNTVSKLLLPAAQLRGLQVLELDDISWGVDSAAASGMSAHQPQPAAALTALTCLWLNPRAAAQCSSSTLAALPMLEELQVYGLIYWGLRASALQATNSIISAVAEALPQLQHLTSFNYLPDYSCRAAWAGGDEAGEDERITVPFSCLQQLQELSISVQHLSLASFEVLPASLMSLVVQGTHNLPGDSISVSKTPGVCQLSALQELAVTAVTLDTAVLAQLSSLAALSIWQSGIFSSAGAPELLVLSKLTKLHRLRLISLWRRPDDDSDDSHVNGVADLVVNRNLSAAEAAAFTASQRLTSLMLGKGVAPLSSALVSSMFPAGRILPKLQELSTICMPMWSSYSAAQQVLGCCLNLQTLDTHALAGQDSGQDAAGAAAAAEPPPAVPQPPSVPQPLVCAQLAVERQLAVKRNSFEALSSSHSLATLSVVCPDLSLDYAAWKMLSALTALSSLTLKCSTTAPENVLHLTACRPLRHVELGLRVVERSWFGATHESAWQIDCGCRYFPQVSIATCTPAS